jgi:trk system potassium uptake protein TrkH
MLAPFAWFKQGLPAQRLTPTRILFLGYVLIIGIGSGLLLLPFATTGDGISWVDAVFTATSATSITGLIVLDTPHDFTLFGQCVILALIQIGGIGYMTIAALFVIILGRRIGMQERLLLQEALNVMSPEGILRFVLQVTKVTLLVEAIGAALFAVRFWEDLEPAYAMYYGIFHSISAFNNAGFTLFSNSLATYQRDVIMNSVAMVLIITGGIGFLVYDNVIGVIRKQHLRLSVHTKMVLSVTAILVVFGTLVVLLFEQANPRTLGMLSWPEKVMVAAFQVVSGRTAGFGTVDASLLTDSTLYFVVFLMFIGGSPGSTGGGIKTTTFGTIVMALWATMRGYRDVMVFYRRIPADIVTKAFYLAGLAVVLVSVSTLILAFVEKQAFLGTLFEVTSAAATVGMSTGDGASHSLSAAFSDGGKLLIALLMLAGRIGPLAISIAVVGGSQHARFRYAEEKVVIG